MSLRKVTLGMRAGMAATCRSLCCNLTLGSTLPFAICFLLMLWTSAQAATPGVNEPPASPRQIAIYMSRDGVRTGGYTSTHDTVTIQLFRNGVLVNTTGPFSPYANDDRDDDDDSSNSINLNFVNGFCWSSPTPRLRPGDQLRTVVVISTGTVSDQTTAQDIKTGRPFQTSSNQVTVQGSARDQNGNPIPVTELQQRLVSKTGKFAITGSFGLKAGGGGKPGTISYDPVGPSNPNGTNWTATYSNLSSSDVTLALAAASKIVWLGTNPTTKQGRTVAENTPGVDHGRRSPPCSAAAVSEPADTISPTPPTITASVSGTTANLSWSGATGDDIRYYNIYRDGVLIKTVGVLTTSYDDPNLANSAYTYTVDAEDSSGNHSGLSNPMTVTVGAPLTATVPEVVGLTGSAATASIIAAGLVVGATTTATSTTVPAGTVISQNPAAGTSVDPGSAVDLVVSLGP